MHGTRITVFIATAALVLIFSASVAMAQPASDPYGDGQPRVGPRREFRQQDNARVRGVLQRRGPAQTGVGAESEGAGLLPFTGADLTLFVATGLALTATGLVIVRRTRARREEAQPELDI